MQLGLSPSIVWHSRGVVRDLNLIKLKTMDKDVGSVEGLGELFLECKSLNYLER